MCVLSGFTTSLTTMHATRTHTDKHIHSYIYEAHIEHIVIMELRRLMLEWGIFTRRVFVWGFPIFLLASTKIHDTALQLLQLQQNQIKTNTET